MASRLPSSVLSAKADWSVMSASRYFMGDLLVVDCTLTTNGRGSDRQLPGFPVLVRSALLRGCVALVLGPAAVLPGVRVVPMRGRRVRRALVRRGPRLVGGDVPFVSNPGSVVCVALRGRRRLRPLLGLAGRVRRPQAHVPQLGCPPGRGASPLVRGASPLVCLVSRLASLARTSFEALVHAPIVSGLHAIVRPPLTDSVWPVM